MCRIVYNHKGCAKFSLGVGKLCSTAYTYTAEGRVAQKAQTIGAVALNHAYTYTADGKLQSETLPSGATIGYTYTQDKLVGVNINGTAYMNNIAYNATGQVTGWQWAADGSQYRKTYDTNGRLKTFPIGNATRTLGYDSTGNITGWQDSNGAAKTKTFSYDTLDRLNGYSATAETQAFQYDANGNRTSKTDNGTSTAYGIAANSNRLTSVGSTTQQLDASGNLLNDGTHAYTYNAQNRLASVDGTTAYTYNTDNQRVKKATPAGTTLYAWDNDRIIGEYDQSGTAQQETIYFGSTPVALLQGGNIYHIFADQIDAPRTIADISGKIVWAWDSKPFGETAPDEDPDKDGLSLHYSQRFPGQIFDAETGLHYNFHRDYNPATGRYVQSDPIGVAGGLDTFGYVLNTPIKSIDPLGQNVAVIIGDMLELTPDSKNLFGHAAMAVSAKGVYSWGTSHRDGTSLCTYLKDQVAIRNVTVDLILSDAAKDRLVIAGFSAVRNNGYSILKGNTCATAVSYGLRYAGIPGFEWGTPLPMDLQRYSQNSPWRYKGIYFKKGSIVDCQSLNYRASLGIF